MPAVQKAQAQHVADLLGDRSTVTHMSRLQARRPPDRHAKQMYMATAVSAPEHRRPASVGILVLAALRPSSWRPLRWRG